MQRFIILFHALKLQSNCSNSNRSSWKQQQKNIFILGSWSPRREQRKLRTHKNKKKFPKLRRKIITKQWKFRLRILWLFFFRIFWCVLIFRFFLRLKDFWKSLNCLRRRYGASTEASCPSAQTGWCPGKSSSSLPRLEACKHNFGNILFLYVASSWWRGPFPRQCNV